jgi:tRNA dimethylallyltransferase
MNSIVNLKELLKNRPVLFLVGPTGIGKTALSVAVAEFLPVEIISADSRQIFKLLDIGTAKPSKEILNKIPHHLISFLRPDEYFSAGLYSKMSRKIIDQIFERKHIPFVVGGSGLYIKALIEGFFELEIRDQKIRLSLRKRLLKEGTEPLYNELKKCDPELAVNIQPNDKQRILRGLEVYLYSGQKLSKLQEEPSVPPNFEPVIFGIKCNRKLLYNRINSRVDEMIDNGLLNEVLKLQKKGFSTELNALNTVGYKEVFEYMDNIINYDEMIEQIKSNSRHYAKRQMTWFNKNKDIRWKVINDSTDYLDLAKEVVDEFRNLHNP